MAEKRIYGRSVQKHDVQKNWEKAENFTPLAGEIIVYDRDENYTYERFKIGDGTTLVNALPFAIDYNNNYSKGLAYTLSDDESYYILSGIGTCTDTDIIIPSTYNGKPVTTIGEWAFYRCSGLTSVVIGDSVTTISGGAFYECINLTSVVIPDSVTTIGMSAFYACSKLTDGYYKGTAEQWALITIDTSNNSLLNATIHYNYADSFIKINNKIDNMAASGNNGLPSCPTEDGNYILRVTNGVPTWVPVLNAEEATF